MKPPSDYLDIVAEGARILHSLGAQLRARAEARPDTPELWLIVRDLEGLAGRLVDSTAEEWQEGSTVLLISGQDIRVLDDIVAGNRPLTAQEVRFLARLRDFLQTCCDRAYDFRVDE
jgi:hypothetical protein